jgi:hypothetical protein
MNWLKNLFNWLMGSKEEISSSEEGLKEETRVLSNVSEEESKVEEVYDGETSNAFLALHLSKLIDDGQLKGYKGIKEFINSIDTTNFSDAPEEINFDLMTITPEIIKLAKKAHLLGYKYPYDSLASYMSEVYRGIVQE